MRLKIGVLYIGAEKPFNETVSLLSNRYDIVPIIDYDDQELSAVVIPDTGVYNSRSGNVTPYRRLPSNPLSVDNAFLLNFLEYSLENLIAAGIKLVAVGKSALTVGDRTGMCKIRNESETYSLQGEAALKTSASYLDTRSLQDCIVAVIRFIEDDDSGMKVSVPIPTDPVLEGELEL